MSEESDLKKTLTNLLTLAQSHAEGFKHMTDALVAFDRRLRALERAPAPKPGLIKPNGFHTDDSRII